MNFFSSSMRLGEPFQPYKRVGYALALAILFVTLAEFAWNLSNPTDRDFISFWSAARLALAGNSAGAYDLDILHSVQLGAATFGTGKLPFAYPPAFLVLVLPFAYLSYPLAMATWSVATFPLYFIAARRMFPDSGWLAAAFPAVFINAAIGQNGFVTAGLFIVGLWLLPKRPFVAGLTLGCLVLKPQLALLLPVALIAAGQWRAIAGAAVSSFGLLALGLVLFGVATTAAWLDQMPLYASIARDGLVGWHKMASVYASARQIGLAAGPAFAIHALIALAAAVAVWRVWRSPADPLFKAAVLAAATMLASPYLFLYDALILVVPFFWLARNGAKHAVLALLWCLPLVSVALIATSPGPLNLGPLVPIALLAMLYRRA